jgi:hypothetical protein
MIIVLQLRIRGLVLDLVRALAAAIRLAMKGA